MWLLWKKLIAYILLLGTASYFGIELLPMHLSKPGSAGEQIWNDQVATALDSQAGAHGTGAPGVAPASQTAGAFAPPVTTPAASTPSALTTPALQSVAPSEAASPPSASTQAPSVDQASDSPQKALSPEKPRISINHATWQELTALPGIGETKAKAIVDYRDRHGGFHTIDELEAVKGIGPRTVDRLRSQVAL